MKKFVNSGQFKKGEPSRNKGKVASIETRKKQSIAKLGRKLSETTKQKMRGKIPWNKGMIGVNLHSVETKKKMSLFRKGIPTPWLLAYTRGENNVNWKGGISKLSSLVRRMPEARLWTVSILQRDSWTCQACGVKGVKMETHHIKAFSKIIYEFKIKSTEDARKCLELWDINNGVTLCVPCHSLTDNYKNKAKQNVYQ